MLWPTNISNWGAKFSFIVLSSMCIDERKTRFWTDVFCFGFRPLARHFQPFKNRNIFMIPKDWYVSHVHCIALARYSLCSVDMINQIFFFVWIEFLWCTMASLANHVTASPCFQQLVEFFLFLLLHVLLTHKHIN